MAHLMRPVRSHEEHSHISTARTKPVLGSQYRLSPLCSASAELRSARDRNCNIPFPVDGPLGGQHSSRQHHDRHQETFRNLPKHLRQVMLPPPRHSLHFSRSMRSSRSVSTMRPCCPPHGTPDTPPLPAWATVVRRAVTPAACLQARPPSIARKAGGVQKAAEAEARPRICQHARMHTGKTSVSFRRA